MMHRNNNEYRYSYVLTTILVCPRLKEGTKEEGIKFVHGEHQNKFKVA
jgi:hypothetical protein